MNQLEQVEVLRKENEQLFAVLRQCEIVMQAFTDPLGEMPEKTGEFNDLADAPSAVCATLKGGAA